MNRVARKGIKIEDVPAGYTNSKQVNKKNGVQVRRHRIRRTQKKNDLEEKLNWCELRSCPTHLPACRHPNLPPYIVATCLPHGDEPVSHPCHSVDGLHYCLTFCTKAQHQSERPDEGRGQKKMLKFH